MFIIDFLTAQTEVSELPHIFIIFITVTTGADSLSNNNNFYEMPRLTSGVGQVLTAKLKVSAYPCSAGFLLPWTPPAVYQRAH